MKQETVTAQPLPINEVLDRYLRIFGELYILKTEQLTKRLYKMGMFTTVQTRLKRLVDAGYLHAIQLPTIKSKSPYMYAVSAKTATYLKEHHDFDVALVYKPSELKELAHPFLWHLLELNDFIILAQTLERFYPEYSLESMRHDLSMKKKPLRIAEGTTKNKKGETVTKYFSVEPDAILSVRQKREGKKDLLYSFVVELDRGTEQTEDTFKEKIRRLYIAIHSGKLQEYFDIKHISGVLFATTTGKNRVEQMRKWTMSILAELHAKPEMVELFLFSFYVSSMSHKHVFFDETWVSPLKEVEPVALLEV